MPDELKPVLARQMEIYAGFMEHTDHHVGQLIDALEDLGILEDTLVYYIIGDNGASAEGTIQGTFNENIIFNGAPQLETAEFMASRIEQFGTPEAYNHFAVGWAHAMDTPYQWTKQVASHWGGTRNGTIVHWPNGCKATDEIRTQFHHVIDVAPTILEAAGIPEPASVNGIPQKPIEGTSMLYSFDDSGCGRAARAAVLRDVLQPRYLRAGLDRRHPTLDALGPRRAAAIARRRRLGAVRHGERLESGGTTSPPTTRRSSPSCSSYGSRRQGSTTCCRSTTVVLSASTRTLLGGHSSSRATPSSSLAA